MAIQVFHHREVQYPFGELEGWDESKYQKVADVNIPDEDHTRVFQLTNNIEHSWIDNKEVTPATENMKFGRGFRSTSVGDIIVLSTGKMLQCASAGWNHIGFMAAEEEWAPEVSEDVDIDRLSRETCEEFEVMDAAFVDALWRSK